MTIVQAKFLADRAQKLFDRAANAWCRGNNSGNNEYLHKCEKRCETLRSKAEALLKPLAIEVDYPGLYPSFKVKGFWHYSTISAVSAALEAK